MMIMGVARRILFAILPRGTHWRMLNVKLAITDSKDSIQQLDTFTCISLKELLMIRLLW